MNMKFDQLLLANVYTMNRQRPFVQAIGIKDKKIVFTGSRKEAEQFTSCAEQIVDLKDKTIFPGFLDTHVHVMPSGVFLEGQDISTAKCIDEVKALLKKKADQTPPGDWIFGTHFQDKNLIERRFLTRKELDEISQAHPIMIYHNDCHPLSFNSLGIKRLELVPDAEYGILMDESGEINGLVVDPACADVEAKLVATFTDARIVQAYQNIENYAVLNGTTTIFIKDYYYVLKVILAKRERYKTTIKPMMRTPAGCSDHSDLDLLLKDEQLRKETTVCTFIDGAFDGSSAAIFEPYEGQPSNFGILYNSDEQLYSYLKKAHIHGMQVSCHVIGDYGIEQFLNTMERILKESPREDHRHRMEHFEMPRLEQIRRTSRLGCACGMQPLLIEICERMDMEGYRCFIGERVKRCSPYRSILDQGVLVGGGSDFGVTSIHPLRGIQICMQHPVESERLSLFEGLEMYTVNAAKIGFLEDRKGMIKPGMDADLVILEKNPYETPTAELSAIKIKATIAAGKVVYGEL
jgi:predicted amidohydrolase YtcJ